MGSTTGFEFGNMIGGPDIELKNRLTPISKCVTYYISGILGCTTRGNLKPTDLMSLFLLAKPALVVVGDWSTPEG